MHKFRTISYAGIYFILLMVLIAGFVLSVTYDLNKQSSINQIKQLYNSQLSLNQKLKQEYSYYNSDLYIQQQAIDNLGLADKNSSIVIIPNQQNDISSSVKNVNSNSSAIEEWWLLIKSKL